MAVPAPSDPWLNAKLPDSKKTDDQDTQDLWSQWSTTMLAAGPQSKFARESAAQDNIMAVSGELTTEAKIDYEKVVGGVEVPQVQTLEQIQDDIKRRLISGISEAFALPGDPCPVRGRGR